MSSRALRKLRGNKELVISHDDDENEDEFDFVSVKSKKRQKAVANPFDLVSMSVHTVYVIITVISKDCLPETLGHLTYLLI